MPLPLAVAPALQWAAILAATAAGVMALLTADPRRRGAAMLAALGAAALGLATVAWDSVGTALGAGTVPVLAALGAGLGGIVVLALLLGRWPRALPLLVVAVLPFRVPVVVGDTAANLLLPLYGVIAAGCLAVALGRLPQRDGSRGGDRPLTALRVALAVVLALYAVQALYSTDLEQAVKQVCFFYVPFALLFRLVADLEWSPRLLQAALYLIGGLAVAFAAVGFYEYATGHLLIPNPKVMAANELRPYFRVNSLFFDPNIYGRFLALTMVALAAVLLWTRRTATAGALAAVLAVLWAGLVLSLSQTSFAALLTGLAVLVALRWRPLPVVAAVGVAVAAAGAVVALAPTAVGLGNGSSRQIDDATSGRLRLVEGGLAMVRDRPVLGFGSGSFAERYRAREGVRSPMRAAISHTIPLTVTAEQGVIGLAGYLALLAAAFALLLGGLRRDLRGPPRPAAVARAAAAAAFAALVVHTLAYAAFLEDPLSWTLLGLAAALRQRAGDQDEPVAGDAAPGVAAPGAPAPALPVA